jgi:hypothetical protein
MEDRREREREGVTESKREREFTQYKSVPMISKMGSKCLSHKCGVFQEYILLFLRVIPVQGVWSWEHGRTLFHACVKVLLIIL